LGWFPGGRYKTCLWRSGQPFTMAHTIHSLQVRHRLMMPQTISDALFFLLNMLPTRKPRSPGASVGQLYRILYELDCLYHAKLAPTRPTHLGQRLSMAPFFSFSLVYFTLDPIHSKAFLS
ncbi:hypothetical protein BCV71DRAFT_191123, partial [Rhizopus microsporus]